MQKVISKDGTSISYDKQGQGPAVLLVGGGLVDHSENASLALELAKNFTVYNYDRRGRGTSDDTLPYSLRKEIEDIEALIAEAGSSAHIFGASSGGALALEAAMAGVSDGKFAVYEVPYMVGDEAIRSWQTYVKNLREALVQDDRDKALELFMRLAGSSDEDIASAKASEFWSGLQKIAPTLMYDATCIGIENGKPPVDRLAKITQPTLVMTGTMLDPNMSQLQPSFFTDAAKAIAESISHATHKVLERQTHALDPKVGTSVLVDFFNVQ